MPDLAEIELEFYERFFFSRDLEPYEVQEKAFSHIFKNEGLLVTVPTGTGKTLIAKAAIYKALAQGQTAIYTTPLRALTEEKYRELCEDFGEDNVGFATGDYKVNTGAPIQVLVAEILWNRIFGDKASAPADVVIMDEGHYFNDPQRGYVWEQSIIGLDPRTQLIILSATLGRPERFCQWVEGVRRVPLRLVDSRLRRVPLRYEYREEYPVETVKDLAATGNVPAILFVFGRERCFEMARLLKSCSRFTSAEEKAEIERRADEVLFKEGVGDELRALLVHGIGIHHAGILPRYKQLVESLALDRLVKFVVSTETIAAGINLPAKVSVFPSLRKFIKGQARLVTPAEFHQMAGRAGRPQFDDEGLAIALAPEEVVQDIRKEVKDTLKRGRNVDEAKIRKGVYARAKAEAQRKKEAPFDLEAHQALVQGQPSELSSRTRLTPEQILAIGLPDLRETVLPGHQDDRELLASSIPAYMNLNIVSVVDNLLLGEREKQEAHRTLACVTDNLKAFGIIDESGQQVAGKLIGELQGLDGLFLWYLLRDQDLESEDVVALVEFLVDHDVIQRLLDRKDHEKRREWIRARFRERIKDSPQTTWEDVEAEYEEKFPRELSRPELWHQAFSQKLPHPELHGGKKQKQVWAAIEASELDFMSFVDTHRLAHEEGSLFSYCARVMKLAESIGESTQLQEFSALGTRVRNWLSSIDGRLSPGN